MFSSRLRWDLRPNRIAALLHELRGSEILDLTQANPTLAGFDYPAEIAAALADPRGLLYEPSPAGLREAREAISAYYGQRVPPECVLLTASTSEAYAYAFKLLADAGDEVLAPRPSYPLFEFLAALEHVRVAYYPLVYDGRWAIDLDALERAITPRTRAIVAVNPNNPTGSFVKPEEFERLAALGLPLVSDEVFLDYSFAASPLSLTTVHAALTLTLSGLSKIAGLPQMKLGWIVAGGERRREALEKLELIADTYLSVATPVQHAAARLLAAGRAVRAQISTRTRSNLDFLQRECPPLHVEGGWYAILQVPNTRSEEEWCLELLARDRVLVQPGFFFDFEREAFLVVSLLTAPQVFQEGMRRLRAHAC